MIKIKERKEYLYIKPIISTSEKLASQDPTEPLTIDK